MTPRAQFEITYDAEADVLGIWLPGPSDQARTRELAPGIHADLTRDGRLARRHRTTDRTVTQAHENGTGIARSAEPSVCSACLERRESP